MGWGEEGYRKGRGSRLGKDLKGWKIGENWLCSQVTKAEDGPQGLPR